MKVEVSIGEVIDKLCILEIKYENIIDENKKKEINNEINELCECEKYKNENLFFYNLLKYVNKKIWDLMNIVKEMNTDNNEYTNISKKIFDYNQKRFRIKNWFNLLTSSVIKEQKSYGLTTCKVIINDDETIYNKVAEINYLLLEYDTIIFDTKNEEFIKDIFKVPTYKFTTDLDIKSIILKDFVIPDEEKKSNYEFIPIKYISGGKFGDFIHQLSVINEFFYKTCRKGVLYICEFKNNCYNTYGDSFTNGLENTYYDTYPLLIKQKYIYDYKIYKGEQFNINLNIWRSVLDICVGWNTVFNNTYNIEWGKHKWIETNYDESFKNKVLINTVDYRFCNNINFYKLYEEYGENLIFISSSNGQYDYFINKTKLNIPFLKINNFNELCCAINSCKLFIGSTSAPLAIAHSVFVNHIVGSHNETQLEVKLKQIWSHLQYGYM